MNVYFAYRIHPLEIRKTERGFFAYVLQALPQAKWVLKTTYVEDILFLEWTADPKPASVSDGVDTFIYRDGMIHIQTVRATLVPKG